MTRVVLDANVVVSGVLNEQGPPGVLLALCTTRQLDAVLSRELAAEYRRALGYPKVQERHRRSASELNKIVQRLYRHAFKVGLELPLPRVVPDDPKDDMVLATALAGEADLVVSGDKHLLALGEYEGIPIVSPAAAVVILKEQAGAGGKPVAGGQ